MSIKLEEIGVTSRGYHLYREENGVGGYRYWTDEVGGGAVVFDTALSSTETIEMCLNHVKEEENKELEVKK